MTAYDETRSTTTPTPKGGLPTPDDERRLEAFLLIARHLRVVQ